MRIGDRCKPRISSGRGHTGETFSGSPRLKSIGTDSGSIDSGIAITPIAPTYSTTSTVAAIVTVVTVDSGRGVSAVYLVTTVLQHIRMHEFVRGWVGRVSGSEVFLPQGAEARIHAVRGDHQMSVEGGGWAAGHVRMGHKGRRGSQGGGHAHCDEIFIIRRWPDAGHILVGDMSDVHSVVAMKICVQHGMKMIVAYEGQGGIGSGLCQPNP